MVIPLLEIPKAIEILKKGGVIAYPTETVYGLGCNATRPESVKKIFEAKGRGGQVPISILISSAQALPNYVQDIPPVALKLIQKYWPGPLTLIFKARQGVFPPELLAGGETIALRVSPHPIARQIVQALGLPLTTTSANKSGQPPARSVEEVRSSSLEIDGVIDGGILSQAQGSTILDVTVDPPRVVREGEISTQDIFDVISS